MGPTAMSAIIAPDGGSKARPAIALSEVRTKNHAIGAWIITAIPSPTNATERKSWDPTSTIFRPHRSVSSPPTTWPREPARAPTKKTLPTTVIATWRSPCR